TQYHPVSLKRSTPPLKGGEPFLFIFKKFRLRKEKKAPSLSKGRWHISDVTEGFHRGVQSCATSKRSAGVPFLCINILLQSLPSEVALSNLNYFSYFYLQKRPTPAEATNNF